MEQQWYQDRDMFWVQDFEPWKGGKSSSSSSSSSPEISPFGARLMSFIHALHHGKGGDLVESRVDEVFAECGFAGAKALLVDSLPVSGEHGKSGRPTTGWRRLAEACKQAAETKGFVRDVSSGDGVEDRGAPIFCLAGSLGNLKPKFVRMMELAMSGYGRFGTGHCRSAHDTHRDLVRTGPSLHLSPRAWKGLEFIDAGRGMCPRGSSSDTAWEDVGKSLVPQEGGIVGWSQNLTLRRQAESVVAVSQVCSGEHGRFATA